MTSLWECTSLRNPNANWFGINLVNSRNGFWSERINRSNLNIQDLYIQKSTPAEWFSKWKYDISRFPLPHTNILRTLQKPFLDLWFNLNSQRIGDQNYNLGFSQTTASFSLLISPNSDQYQFFLYSYVIKKKGYTNYKLTK